MTLAVEQARLPATLPLRFTAGTSLFEYEFKFVKKFEKFEYLREFGSEFKKALARESGAGGGGGGGGV
jgi:hypothetical protein